MTTAVEANFGLSPSTMTWDCVVCPDAHGLRNTITIAAITLLVLLIALWPAFERYGALDEGIMLVYPELICRSLWLFFTLAFVPVRRRTVRSVSRLS